MTVSRSRRTSRARPAIAASAAILAAACSSNPEPVPVIPDPVPAVEAPPPLPPPPQAEAPDKLQAALKALGESDYAAAYAGLLEVVELCGSAPLGQQALLLIAATELDPRNPDPRRSLATESTSLLLSELDSTSWAGRFAESFYLIGRRLGARQLGAEDTEALELGWVFRNGHGRQPSGGPAADENSALIDEDPREWAEVESAASESAEAMSGRYAGGDDTISGWSGAVSRSGNREREGGAASYCEALWAAPSIGDGQGMLPSLPGSSYPAQVSALRRQVRDLEEELERIRRIVTEQ